ncbi:MAG: bis-aminopropyl spermidine synthase family protein [Anaerolineae bacterium]|nr:bis-aminopropyl spermidine synthase family protein [Anaerolineae bacterium]
MGEYQTLKTKLPDHITEMDVQKIIRAILSDNAPWDWFARARIPFPFAVNILRELQAGDYIKYVGDKTELTPRGQQLADEVGAHAVPTLACPTCGTSGSDWSPLRSEYDTFLEIFKASPTNQNPDLDQGEMTPESTFRRISWMLTLGDITGKRVAHMGDDDLTSIALALTKQPQEIVVFEIDSRLCSFISDVARARNLPIRVIQQDLTKRLPAEFGGTFDTFVCDPPETREGLLLFVEKGLTLLKPGDGHAGYFGSTVIEGSLNKWKQWQKKLMCDYEIVYTHIFPAFTLYVSWHDEMPLPDLPPLAQVSDREWYRFAWNRIETMASFKPAQDFETEMQKLFYFDAESYYLAFPQSRV